MRKGIFLGIAVLLLAQGTFTGGKGTTAVGLRESVATPLLNVKSIHPLPDWHDPQELRPRGSVPADGPAGVRLKVSFPVGLLAMLLFFLMWKFLQSQE